MRTVLVAVAWSLILLGLADCVRDAMGNVRRLQVENKRLERILEGSRQDYADSVERIAVLTSKSGGLARRSR